ARRAQGLRSVRCPSPPARFATQGALRTWKPSPPEGTVTSPPRRCAMSKEQPLSVRLYFQEPLYALARIVGYGGLPVPEVKERARPLLEKYGKERMAK